MTSLRKIVEDVQEYGHVEDYEIRLCGSMLSNPYGVILSVYPNHKRKILWIDVCDKGDPTV